MLTNSATGNTMLSQIESIGLSRLFYSLSVY